MLDQATELKEAEAPVDSPQMQWWVRFVLSKLLAEVFTFFKEHAEERLQEILERVVTLVERRGLYWQPEVQRMDGIILSGWLRTTCFPSWIDSRLVTKEQALMVLSACGRLT